MSTVATAPQQTLQIQATVASPNPLTNTAVITHSDQFDPNTANNAASATITPPPQQADLGLSKTVSNATPNVGDTVTFTVALSNSGPNTATNVTVTDLLPAGLSLVSATPSQGTYSPGSGLWTVGTVANATSQTLQIQATVVSPSASTNTATISHSDQTDGNPGNNSASATVTPQQADLSLSKTVSNANPTVGTNVTFTVTLRNLGPDPATNVTVNDLLPAGLTFVSATPSQGSYNSGTGVWTVGTVTTATQQTLQIQATVVSPSMLTNTATVTHSDQFDPNTANNSASVAINAGGNSAPTISKVFGAASIPVGGTTSLTFTLTNPNGATMLTGVSFSDPFPAGLVVATPNALTSNCGGTSTATAGSGNYTLTNGTLSAGGSCTVSLNVTGTTAGVKVNTTSAVTSIQAPNSATATATLTVGALTTATTLTSSRNPSTPGQPVTFTATVTASGGTPTGTVTFMDAGNTIGTGTLSGGIGTFTTAALTLGSHSITASYAGASGFSPSVSSVLAQVVGVPADSVKLRSLQLGVTKIEAQSSGNAFSSAVGGAIADGFSDNGGALINANEGSVHLNFAAEPGPQTPRNGASEYDSVIGAREGVLRGSGFADGSSNLTQSSSNAAPINDAFGSLAYAGTDRMPTKAPPRIAPPAAKDWQIWADVRGTGWNTDVSAGDIHGGQVNAFAGVTRRLTSNFLVGVVGGYENFDYTSNTLNGRLKGDGWTVGGYLGWRLWDDLRFNASVGRSSVSYDGAAGTASATFPGSRWIASADLIGTYRMALFEIEPSAKVYALWEHDGQYLDSLGTLQSTNDFSTGRASGGVKVGYPWHLSPLSTFTPFVGVYGDYYFSSSNAVPLLLPTEFVQGWSARITAGINYNTTGGAKLTIGGELGGLGNDFTTWSVRGRASLPF